MSWLTNTKYMS